MTLKEAVESRRAFKRPHWRAAMIAYETRVADGISRSIVWESSGDEVQSFSQRTALATDYILVSQEPPAATYCTCCGKRYR